MDNSELLAAILRRFLESDAYIRLTRPLDDEGDERLDVWTLVIDGRVEISKEELLAFQSVCAHREWYATNPARCVRCQKSLPKAVESGGE